MPHTVTAVDLQAPIDVPERLGADGRYQILQHLGQGSFGAVYKALDTRYGSLVAIKVLRGRAVASLYRFKQEFRGLADLGHPNLVQLYELSSEGWFVVMELVDGVDLLQYLAGPSAVVPASATVTVDPGTCDPSPGRLAPYAPPDLARLRATFAQLAQGLMALHAAGKLHRDIKPSNILVAREGRLVLLDFGLVADVDCDLHALLERGAGTPAYMAPEQRDARVLTERSDWYAVGATLHAALTGAPPGPDHSLRDGTAHAPDTPDALVDLCRRLIDPDPARRPGGAEVLAVLGATGRAPRPAPAPVAFLGRDAELAALDEACAAARATPVLLRVTGASGVGKTALVDAWLARVAARDPATWVLRGRCLEHEHIPFKAIDGVVDALVARLLGEPADARAAALPESAPGADLLARMFPVLAGLRAPDSLPDAAPGGGDPRALRDRALTALRELFERVAARHPLVLCIDDAHWGDADSARALAELLRPSLRGLALVVAQRPTADPLALPNELERWLPRDPASLAVRDVALAELDEGAARSLARACLDAAPGDAARLAARIAQEAGGSPFFIRQLASDLAETAGDDAGAVALSGLLRRQLDRLPPPVRRLVEVLSLAARPLPEDVAARAAGVDPAAVRPAVLAAERSRLVAGAVVDGALHLETGHARVREEVVRALDRDAARSHHLAIADTLLAAGQREPEVLLPHLLGAGDTARASAAALHAAARAAQAFAFDRAAELYGLVLELGADPGARAALFEKRGDALANAGRSAAAAEALEAAVEARDGAVPPALLSDDARLARRTLRRRSGELRLRSGYVARGTATLKTVLDELQIAMPATERAALRTSALRRLRLLARGMDFAPRDERAVPPATLERLDALWGVTTSLVMLRPLIADALGLQHLLEALAAGEPTRVLRALALEVSFEALLGGPYFDRRCDRMLDQMERVAEGMASPYFRAWCAMCRGVAGWLRGHWDVAWSSCRAAAAAYAREPRGLSWELAVCDVYGLSAATYLGRFADLAAVVPERHRAARERGDLYATANLAFFESFLLLARDEPDAAIRGVAEGVAPFLDDDSLANRYGPAYAVAQGELYRGDADAAWALVERDWASWERIGMVRVQGVRVEARYLRARVAVALLARARQGRGPRPGVARRARGALAEDLARLAADRIPPASPLARAARAGVAAVDGRSAAAAALLREAVTGFERCGMRLHAGAARHHLAYLTQRAADADAADRAAGRLADEGVVRPERMFHLVIPGFAP